MTNAESFRGLPVFQHAIFEVETLCRKMARSRKQEVRQAAKRIRKISKEFCP